METVIIEILALVSLTLSGALLVVVRRPDQRQGGMKDILENPGGPPRGRNAGRDEFDQYPTQYPADIQPDSLYDPFGSSGKFDLASVFAGRPPLAGETPWPRVVKPGRRDLDADPP